MGNTVGKILMAVIVLYGASMVLRNTGGTSQVINTSFGGFEQLLAGAGGSNINNTPG